MTGVLVNPDALRDPGEVAEVAETPALPMPGYVAPAGTVQVALLTEAARGELERAAFALDEQEFRSRLIAAWALLKTALGAAENAMRETGDLQ